MKKPSWIEKIFKKEVKEVNPFTGEAEVLKPDYSEFKFESIDKTVKKARILKGPLISKIAKIGAMLSFLGNTLMIFAVSFVNGGIFNIYAFILFILSTYYIYAYLRLTNRDHVESD